MGPSTASSPPEQLSLLLLDAKSSSRQVSDETDTTTRNSRFSLVYLSATVVLIVATLTCLTFAPPYASFSLSPLLSVIVGLTLVVSWAHRFVGFESRQVVMIDYVSFLLCASVVLIPYLAGTIALIIQVGLFSSMLIDYTHAGIVNYFQRRTRDCFNSSFPILKVLSDSLSRNPLTLNPGVWIRIAQGEIVPVDGSVISGEGVVRSHHLQGTTGGIRICRAGDEIRAGEVIVEGALAVKVEKPWPYHEYAKFARFAEEAFDTIPRTTSADSKVAQWFLASAIVSSALLIGLEGAYVEHAVFILLTITLFAQALATRYFLRLVDTSLFGTLYRAGILMSNRRCFEALSLIDGISVSAGNDNYPIVRRESLFLDGVDPVQFAKLVLNLIGPALDDWAVALKEYLIRKIPPTTSILQGIKSLSRFATNGFRAEYDGYEILIGDEPALRSRGIVLELSEVSLSVKDAVVYFVALNGEVAARYEIELFPSNELSQQLENVSHHGVYVDVKTQRNLDPHNVIPGAYKFYSNNRECGFAVWEMHTNKWQTNELARLMSHRSFLSIPRAIIKVKVLSHFLTWSRVAIIGLTLFVPAFLFYSWKITSLSAIAATIPLALILLTTLSDVLVGLVSSEKI